MDALELRGVACLCQPLGGRGARLGMGETTKGWGGWGWEEEGGPCHGTL